MQDDIFLHAWSLDRIFYNLQTCYQNRYCRWSPFTRILTVWESHIFFFYLYTLSDATNTPGKWEPCVGLGFAHHAIQASLDSMSAFSAPCNALLEWNILSFQFYHHHRIMLSAPFQTCYFRIAQLLCNELPFTMLSIYIQTQTHTGHTYTRTYTCTIHMNNITKQCYGNQAFVCITIHASHNSFSASTDARHLHIGHTNVRVRVHKCILYIDREYAWWFEYIMLFQHFIPAPQQCFPGCWLQAAIFMHYICLCNIWPEVNALARCILYP